jgi:hypothetical protein
MECPIVEQVWALSPMPLLIHKFRGRPMSQWVKMMVKPEIVLGIHGKKAKEFTLLAALTCDIIWMERNRIRIDGGHADPMLISSKVSRSFKEHKSAWQSISSSIYQSQSWLAPPRGWVKCNFDATVKENKVVYATVVRDEEGSILKAWAQEDVAGSLLWAEAKAALFANICSKQARFKKLILEGDSLTVVNAINDPKGVHPWVIGPIVEDILLHLTFFVSWKALFVKRNLNSVTHNLASWTFFLY